MELGFGRDRLLQLLPRQVWRPSVFQLIDYDESRRRPFTVKSIST